MNKYSKDSRYTASRCATLEIHGFELVSKTLGKCNTHTHSSKFPTSMNLLKLCKFMLVETMHVEDSL